MHINPSTFNQRYPIVQARVYPGGGWSLVREAKVEHVGTVRGKKQSITELSKRSLDKLRFYAQCTSMKFQSMLTLTYGAEFPFSGKKVKSHLNHMLTWLRQKFGKFSYLWFMEFQERDAPHVHILMSLPEPCGGRRKIVARKWSEIVSRETSIPGLKGKVFRVHNHRKAWERIKTPDGAARYVCKYAVKPQQKIVPQRFGDVGRFWGASRDVKPKPLVTMDVEEPDLRAYLIANGHKMSDADILPKHLYQMDKKIART